MIYLAHTENVNGEVHYLNDHLRSVGTLAERFICEANPDLCEMSRWAGLLHDLGKYRDEFQEYLNKERESGIQTHHAIYGAALAFEKRWAPIAFAIAAHHAGLHDLTQLQDLIKNPAYDAENRLPSIIKRFEDEIEKIADNLTHPLFIGQDKLKLELATRMIFSSLIDADFLDTEAHYNAAQRSVLPKLNPNNLLEKLDYARKDKAEQARKSGKNLELVEIRNQIYEQCLKRAEEQQGFFSLTVPTGGGKTLSSMAFALKHAEIHNLRRVIVVIPYLSIIEQNSQEYKTILDANDEGLLIENHSAVKVEAESREENNASEARERSPLVLAAENWDAPIIVTTSVQFIESLFSNKTSRCRKLHNIARSVIIFDEVQTLPAHLLEPLFSVWRELAESYGVSFVFSSATQPAFRRQFNLKKGFDEGEMREIIENTNEIFHKLQRVRYELPKPNETRTLSEIADEMSRREKVLCVVNTRRQAFDLFEELRKRVSDSDGIFHLSSAMCAEHRLEVITKIKRLLAESQSCRVVSTQLVEAGVDLDFPFLFRALAPLDSIVQAAGRCNREGRLDFGEVKVFVPAEHSLPKGVYKTATQITSSLLSRYNGEQLATEPHIFADYFSQLFQYVDAGVDIEKARKELNYRTVAQSVKVIEDAGLPVIVPFEGENGNAMRIVREIRGKNANAERLLFGKNDLRRLQRFMVNVRPRDFEILQAKGQLTPLVEAGEDAKKNLDLWVLNIASYNEQFGVLIDKRPSNEFIL